MVMFLHLSVCPQGYADVTHPTGMHSCFRDSFFLTDLQLHRSIETKLTRKKRHFPLETVILILKHYWTEYFLAQESIPVGYVPPAFLVPEGGVLTSWGVCLFGGGRPHPPRTIPSLRTTSLKDNTPLRTTPP